jgi:exonuclease SbcC
MIEQVRVRNFRRYKDTTGSFIAGVNFIEGENNVGKTSLLYAIEYALFGKVEGFKSQTSLMKPGAKGMGVEITFRGKENTRYQLQRVHSYAPKSRKNLTGYFTLKQLQEDGSSTYLLASDFQDTEDVLALKLQELTGLTRRLFALAVHMKQGEIARILEGSGQLDIVLGVTAAVVAEEELRSIALELEKETGQLPILQESVRRVQEEATQLDLRAGSLSREETDAKEAANKTAAERDKARAQRTLLEPLAKAARSLGEAVDRYSREESLTQSEAERLEALTQEAGSTETLQQQLSILSATQEVRAAELAALDRQTGESENARRSLDGTRGDLEGRIRRRRALPAGDGAACESCGAPIDAAHNAKEIASWEAEKALIEQQIAEASTQISTFKTQRQSLERADKDDTLLMQRYKSQQDGLDRQSKALSARKDSLQSAAAAVSQAASLATGSVSLVREHFSTLPASFPEEPDALRRALEDALNSVRQDLAAQEGRIEAEAQAAASNLRRLQDELSQVASRQSALERERAGLAAKITELSAKAAKAARLRTISKGYKDLQVQLREQASVKLAEDAWDFHKKLSGMPEEFTAVSIDPAKYSLQVNPKDIGEEVPAWLYEGGGHRLLLGLSYRLAVVRLVGRCPFVLMDEPTYGLDRTRLHALLERITELGLSEQILLITHQAMGQTAGHHVTVKRSGADSVISMENVV